MLFLGFLRSFRWLLGWVGGVGWFCQLVSLYGDDGVGWFLQSTVRSRFHVSCRMYPHGAIATLKSSYQIFLLHFLFLTS